VIKRLINVIPQCFQFPQVCSSEILVNENNWRSPLFEMSNLKIEAELVLAHGKIVVYYSTKSSQNKIAFLHEEMQFLNVIAQHIDNYIVQKLELQTCNSENLNESDAQWRMNVARLLSQKCPLKKLGIIAIYLIGSVKSLKAGPASDIDFLVHYKNENYNKNLIEAYFSGWDHSIINENLKRTGYQCESIIELHLITDEDIKNKTSYTVMIGAIENNALLLIKESDE